MAYKLKVLLMSDVAVSIYEESGLRGLKKAYNSDELCLCDVEYVEKTFRTKAARDAFIDGMGTVAECFSVPEYVILDNRCKWE